MGTPGRSCEASHGLKLDLADGRRWVIRPVDDKAAAIVAELGKAMRLGPGEVGRELCVAVCEESDDSDRSYAEVGGTVVCRLAAPTDRDMQVLQMVRIASTVAREALVRGGLLLHGALAEYQGSGFIMAGLGTVGKSTASRRLPSPWRSLCDDTTLVVRDGKGRFWAHPWPTWSLFYFGGPGSSWAVERAVALRAIFFLDQAPADQLEPVNATQATALTLASAVDLARTATELTEEDGRTLLGDGVIAARALASAVPAFSLKLSLDGRFWEEIERVLPVGPLPGAGEDSRDRDSVAVESHITDGSLRVVYAGTSMNPTLCEPDLLEVEPYGLRQVQVGDVVCFKSPEVGTTVVHRVAAVGSGGIRTRGDNNAACDQRVLQADDIIGRVKAAQRGPRRRMVHGGWRGPMVLRCARLGRGIRRYAGPLPHTLYHLVAGLGPFDRLLPASLRPRLVRFDARYLVFLKLLSGRQAVGQYDYRLDKWHIQRPFRLFVDEQTLRKAVGSRSEVPD
jgi:SynChlorMet cassette protein ScmC